MKGCLLIVWLIFCTPLYGENLYLIEVLKKFNELTTAQKQEINEVLKTENATVYVNGEITDVKHPDAFSEVKGEYIEVSVRLEPFYYGTGFLPLPKYKEFARADKGQKIIFRGRLFRISDWGLWLTGYVIAE